MTKKRVLIALVLLSFFILNIGLVSAKFEISSILLKVSAKEWDLVKRPISLSSDEGGEFNLELVNLNGVTISGPKIVLEKGESKSAELTFNASNVAPGVYVGKLKITGSGVNIYVPIIFEVESLDVFFDLNLEIASEHTEVAPGENIVAQVKIFDLTAGGTSNGLGAQEVKLEYSIHGLDGRIISSQTENVVVKRDNQLTKSLSLPKDIKEGDYVVSAVVKYGSSTASSTSLFAVKKRNTLAESVKSNNWQLLLIILGILAFFVIMILFFVYLLKDRDKFLIELNKHHESEMKRGKELIVAQTRAIKKKPGVTKKEVKKAEEEAKEKISKLKKKITEKQKKRSEELRKLRKKGKTQEMKKKLREWKSEGYNVSSVELKMRGLGKAEMQRILSDWKKKYQTEGYKNK